MANTNKHLSVVGLGLALGITWAFWHIILGNSRLAVRLGYRFGQSLW